MLACLGCSGGELTLPNGAPARLEAVRGNGQTAPVGDVLAEAPALVVHDADGDPVSGIMVDFTVSQGGGHVERPSAATDGSGVATAGGWTLGTAPGPNILQASVRAATDILPVTFTAFAISDVPSTTQSTIAADPAVIAASRGSNASAIVVTVVDRYDNPLPGISVSLSAEPAGISLEQPALTDGAGKATGRFSATRAGEHTVTAAVAGGSGLAVVVRVLAAPPDPASTTAEVPGGTTGSPTLMRLHLDDAFGNPVVQSSQSISADLSGPNAGASFSLRELGSGEYRVDYTPTTPGDDRVSLSVNGVAVPGSPFASRVAVGPADPSHTSADVPASLSLFDTADLVVTVRDRYGNALGRGGDVVGVMAMAVGVETALNVLDLGDGRYSTRFKPALLSTYTLTITLNGGPIAGSPYRIRITLF